MNYDNFSERDRAYDLAVKASQINPAITPRDNAVVLFRENFGADLVPVAFAADEEAAIDAAMTHRKNGGRGEYVIKTRPVVVKEVPADAE